LTLIEDDGEIVLRTGDCAAFPKGTGNGHHLVNRTQHDVIYLEVGDRSAGDGATYPDDDLVAVKSEDGRRRSFTRKDGTPY